MFDTFRNTLGQDMAAKDFNEMFMSTDVEKFIENSNNLTAKYMKPKREEKGSSTSVDKTN